MIEDGLLGGLLEFGAMGMFAAFLVWQYTKMQARFDALVEKFQQQLEGIQDKNDANEQKLRDRYDNVISQLQDDKTTFRVNVADQISTAMRHIDSLKDKVEKSSDTLQIQVESISLNQRNTHLLVEKGMGIMNKIEDDAKLKALAKKMAKE